MWESVADLVCEIFRTAVLRVGRLSLGAGFCSSPSPLICEGRTRRSPGEVRFGELPLCCGITLIASFSSFRFSICLPLLSESPCPSSSLDDSGGEMTAPGGMARESTTGGGDCRTDGDEWVTNIPFKSSDVPGGVMSGVDASAAEGWGLTTALGAEGVRRCLVM